MPKRNVKIRDIAVVKRLELYNPVGEAPKAGEATTPPMTDIERKAMCDRLTDCLSTLIEHAKSDHVAKRPADDQDYITRLSTNEFYFYTKEPLTLAEFEQLQNHIADKMKEAPTGVQMILGSFSVKTAENKVMNVTPHVTSGNPPDFHFIVKNQTSSIDVRYKGADGMFLTPFDIRHAKEADSPKIKIQGQDVSFTFNNVIRSKSPGDRPFYTLIDVCLDHAHGIAKRNFKQVAEAIQEEIDVSHVVVSNSIPLQYQHCVGQIMHVDPVYTHTGARAGVVQQSEAVTFAHDFGSEKTYCYGVSPTACMDYTAHQQFEAKLATLISLSAGKDDQEMNAYIGKCIAEWEADPEKKEAILAKIEQVITGLNKPINLEIASIIKGFKDSWTPLGTGKKASRIENALAQVPIEQRVQLATSQDNSIKGLKNAIASHRHFFRSEHAHLHDSGEVNEETAAASFKNMKHKFEAAVAPVISKAGVAPKEDDDDERDGESRSMEGVNVA